MKKHYKLILFLALLLLAVIAFCACENFKDPSSISVLISGDIETVTKVNFYNFLSFEAEEDGITLKMKGFSLSDFKDDIKLLSEDNFVILSGSDGASAMVDYKDLDLIYLVEEDNEINVIAPDHPRCASIKDLVEITIVSKEELNSVSFLSNGVTTNLSEGNIRLKFFQEPLENKKFDIAAYKLTPSYESFRADAFTGQMQNMVYLLSGDIINVYENFSLVWEEGKFSLKSNDENLGAVRGIIGGIQDTITKAFIDAMLAIDNDKRVMMILTDGFSYLQANQKTEGLKVLNGDFSVVGSVYPAISNVALASIVTGGTPYGTGILIREVKKPKMPDIFDYAVKAHKTTSYIEGNGNLILTNISPILNTKDIDGSTDKNVYNSAKSELVKNPDLTFVHFHGIDDVNHEFSPESEQAKAKIKEIDGYIYDLIGGFTGTVIIVSDHGAVTQNNNGVLTGSHGTYFSEGDMLVPYYLIEK